MNKAKRRKSTPVAAHTIEQIKRRNLDAWRDPDLIDLDANRPAKIKGSGRHKALTSSGLQRICFGLGILRKGGLGRQDGLLFQKVGGLCEVSGKVGVNGTDGPHPVKMHFLEPMIRH